MPVDLEFQEDPRQASAVLATDPEELFRETVLIVPVRFRVDGHDMLPIRASVGTMWAVDPSGTAAPSEPVELESWTLQPLLGFLLGLRQAIEEAHRSGQARCYLIEDRDLTFKLGDGSQLEVTSPNGITTGVAPIGEFTDAVGGFERDIQGWLQEQAPQLMEHPSWVEWFPRPES